jgi:hypothetical protein
MPSDKMISCVTQQDYSDGSQSLKDRIRERAYEMWTAQGCVDGQADQHWLAAEREILASVTNALARNGIRQKKRRPLARAKTPRTPLRAAS